MTFTNRLQPVWLLLLLVGSVQSWSLNSLEQLLFEDPQQQRRYEALLAELRCPKCQNQSLFDSNSLIAEDMRRLTLEKIKTGESDLAIKDYFRRRYGDFVLYRPPLQLRTLLLWFTPLLVLGVMLIGLMRYQAKLKAVDRMTDDAE